MAYSPNLTFRIPDNDYSSNDEYNFNSGWLMRSGEGIDLILWTPEWDIKNGEMVDCDLTVKYFNVSAPYNLTICQKEYNWEYNNQCSMYVSSGESIDVELTIFKNYNFDFVICQESQDELDDSKDLDFNYSGECLDRLRLNQINGGQIGVASLEFEFITITVPGKGTDVLELTNCDTSTNLNIESCQKSILVSGKNKQFDILLCGGETNPQPIDTNPHIFSFNRPWNYKCDVIELTGYSGESSLASMVSGINLPLTSNYSGEECEIDYLSLEIQFTNMNMISGEYVELSSFDTRPAVQFIFDCFGGEYVELDLYRTLYLDTDINYSGEMFEDDYLTTTPPIRFENDYYSGEYADADFARTVVFNANIDTGENGLSDLKLDPLIELENPTVDTGEEVLPIELTDKPAPSMYPFGETGEMGLSYLNVTYTMYPFGETGEEGIFNSLNLDTTISPYSYTGEYSDADFKDNSPDILEPNINTGENMVSIINTSFVLYPRVNTGEEFSPFTLTTIPFEGITAISYNGEYADIPELDEETEYYLADKNGENIVASLSREISFDFKSVYSGESCITESLNLDYILLSPENNYSGEYANIEFLYVTPGAKIEIDYYSGEYAESDTGILHYPIFLPEIIISSQNMRDGWGQAGGLNFCEKNCCQYDYDGQPLIFDVRPDGQDRPSYGFCGPIEDTKVEFNLTMGVRFFPNAYSGETGIMYMIREYVPFGEMDGSCDDFQVDPTCENDGFDGDGNPCELICSPLVCIDGFDRDGNPCIHDDLYWLYNRNPIKNRPIKIDYLEPNCYTGEKTIVWWEGIAQGEDDFGDFLTGNAQEFKIDLTLVPLVGLFETGENVIASISYDDADWKYPFKENRGGSSALLTGFGSEEYFRFCPGYLLPKGDNVIFDFASPIFTGCYGNFAKTGESLAPFDLLTEDGLSPRVYTGEMIHHYLSTYGPWELLGYTGERVSVKLSLTVLIQPKTIQADQTITAHLYRPPTYWSVDVGESGRLAQLSVSLPGIRWITPDGCIENRYNPLTPDGDLDLDYDNHGICIEHIPYFGKLEAICDDSVYIYYNILNPFVMGNNMVTDLTLSNNIQFNLECSSGEQLYIDEYVSITGEEVSCELSEFLSESLGEFEENRGGQSSFGTFQTTKSLYPIAESGSMVECELDDGIEPTILEFG